MMLQQQRFLSPAFFIGHLFLLLTRSGKGFKASNTTHEFVSGTVQTLPNMVVNTATLVTLFSGKPETGKQTCVSLCLKGLTSLQKINSLIFAAKQILFDKPMYNASICTSVHSYIDTHTKKYAGCFLQLQN